MSVQRGNKKEKKKGKQRKINLLSDDITKNVAAESFCCCCSLSLSLARVFARE